MTYRNKNKIYWIRNEIVDLIHLRATDLEDQIINKLQGNIIKIEKKTKDKWYVIINYTFNTL